MERQDILSRYRQLRDICNQMKDDASKHLPEAAVLRLAKRIGMAKGRTLFCQTDNEYQLLTDLALFMPSANGGPSALQRYARSVAPVPGSREAAMLRAMLTSRLSVWAPDRRHDIAGLVFIDVLTTEEIWVVDMNLEASFREGLVFAGRIAQPAEFAMTFGMLAPIRFTEMLELIEMGHHERPEDGGPEAAFGLAICAAALRTGAMDYMISRSPEEASHELQAVAS